MKKSLLNQKIPTILGLLILLASIAGGFFFINKSSFQLQNKGTSSAPKNVVISNIQDNQFNVSWTTDEKTSGAIKYNEQSDLKKLAKDDRDQRSGEIGEFYLHYVTIKNLQPIKTYYFKIKSGNKLYGNNSSNYTVTTGPSLGSAGEAKIISGNILNPDSSQAKEVIVFISSTNMSPISTLTDNHGRWAIFLNKSRTPDFSAYAIFDPEATILNIKVQGKNQIASAIVTTKNAFPVPDIILGHKPYDYREVSLAEKTPLQAPIEPKNKKTPSQFVLEPISTPSATPNSLSRVTIDNPATPGEKINTYSPEFRGKGPISKVLTIKIKSPTTYSSTVTVDENGQWNFTPSDNLAPGKHTIYVSYVDENGTNKTISRNFTILASGKNELPAMTATSSGETLSSPYPSASISSSPSSIPVTRNTLPSTEEGVPATGVISPTIIVFLIGLLLIFSGGIKIIVLDKG